MPVGTSNGDFFESEMDAIMKRYPELKSPGTPVPKFENNAPAASSEAPRGGLKGNLSDMDMILPDGTFFPRVEKMADPQGQGSDMSGPYTPHPKWENLTRERQDEIWNTWSTLHGEASDTVPLNKEDFEKQIGKGSFGVFSNHPKIQDVLKSMPHDVERYDIPTRPSLDQPSDEDDRKLHFFVRKTPLVSMSDEQPDEIKAGQQYAQNRPYNPLQGFNMVIPDPNALVGSVGGPVSGGASIASRGLQQYREGIAHLNTPTAAPTPASPTSVTSQVPPAAGSIASRGLGALRREYGRDTETGRFGTNPYPTTTVREPTPEAWDIRAARNLGITPAEARERLNQIQQSYERYRQEPYMPGRDALPAGVERVGTAYRFNPDEKIGQQYQPPVGKIKLEPPSQITVSGKPINSPEKVRQTWHFVDEAGKVVGYVRVKPEDEGKHLHIDMISSYRNNPKIDESERGSWRGAFSLGADRIKDIFAGLKEIYPKAETIGGLRVSGARTDNSKYVTRSLVEPYGKVATPKSQDSRQFLYDWER